MKPSHLSSLDRQAAFSLIEALLVAAILAILALLGFGVAGKFGERGRAVECIHRLRSNAVLIHATIQENRGFLPYYDKRLSGYNGLWWHKMYRTAGMPAEDFSRNLVCPINDRPRHLNLGSNQGFVTLGYRYNRRTGYHDGSSSDGVQNPAIYPIINLAQHPSPARVPILADGSNYPTDNALAFDEWMHLYAAHGAREYGRALGHYGHVLFLDGHVERINKPGDGEAVAGDYDLKIRER